MAKCTSIVKVDTIAGVGDVLQVTIDNTKRAYWFYDYAEAMQFLDKDVVVEYRKDMYKGNLEDFIATFVLPTIVQTLDKTNNFKLYVDQEDNNANVVFCEIEDGDNRLGCIVFCTHSEFKSSAKATWMELTIRDRKMHTATLRLFSYDNKEADYSGMYIKTNLSKSQYGFQSELIKPLDNEVFANPEIQLAKDYIKKYFVDDPVASLYIKETNVLEFLSEVVDYEKGYGLMRLAMELSMVDSMDNITKDVNLIAIGQALLMSRGHYTQSTVTSDSFANMYIAIKYPLPNKRPVLLMLDEALTEKTPEYRVMKSIQDTVSTILQVRKGTLE